MMTDERALVLFSRGQDTATCLALALETFGWVETVGFDYGQRHRVELEFRVVFRQGKITTNQAWGACLGPDHLLDLSILG